MSDLFWLSDAQMARQEPDPRVGAKVLCFPTCLAARNSATSGFMRMSDEYWAVFSL